MDFQETTFCADMRRAVRLHFFGAARDTLLITFLFSLLLLAIHAISSMNGIAWLFWIGFAAFVGICFYLHFRTALKKRDKLAARFAEIDGDALAAMEKKYEAMQPEFSTLFLLEEYIYFPDDMLLIPYSEIAAADADFPRIRLFRFFRVSIGASLKIICTDGRKYSVKIRDSGGFKEYHERFLRSLDGLSEAHRRDFSDYSLQAADSANVGDCKSGEAAEKLCGKAFRFDIVKVFAADVIIVLFFLWLFSSMEFELGESGYKAFLAISAAVDAVAMTVIILLLSRKRENMVKRTDKFSPSDFEKIKRGQAMFGTVFMLDDCLWFFWENVSIDYTSIKSLSEEFHIFGAGLVRFELKRGGARRVWIRKWYEYKAYHSDFSAEIRKKISEKSIREVL